MAGRAMVTGAAGFIGAHLVRRLASRGHEVVALDVHASAPHLESPGVTYHAADVRDLGELRRLLHGVDIVHHLASVHLEVHASETAFEEVNVRAAENLVNICCESGVRRLVHTSSVGIYGHIHDPPASEDAPKNPGSIYERTKLAGETAVLKRARELSYDVVVLRPAWVYGAGCPRTAKLMRALQKGRFLFIGRGSNLRHPVFIGDLLDAYELTGVAGDVVRGQGYIIAGPSSVTLGAMIDTFARVLEVPTPTLHVPRAVGWSLGVAFELAFRMLRREPPFSRRSLVFFENDNAFDTSAAKRDFGFEPTVELEEGLRRILEDRRAERQAPSPVDQIGAS